MHYRSVDKEILFSFLVNHYLSARIATNVLFRVLGNLMDRVLLMPIYMECRNRIGFAIHFDEEFKSLEVVRRRIQTLLGTNILKMQSGCRSFEVLSIFAALEEFKVSDIVEENEKVISWLSLDNVVILLHDPVDGYCLSKLQGTTNRIEFNAFAKFVNEVHGNI